MKITVREGEPPLQVRDMEGANEVIADAHAEARSKDKLNVIFLEVDNGNELSIAVGGTDTVLGFTYAHGNPPYFASKGPSETVAPVFTCYTTLEHHTEYPRSWVISLDDGMTAVREFFDSGELPKCVRWTQV